MTAELARDRRSRTTAVLAILAGGAIGIIGSTQPWLDVVLRDGVQLDLAVPGASAMSVLAPLSLAALALGLALTIVGRPLRYAFGVLALGLGAWLISGSLRIAISRPLDAVAAEVTDATGLSGLEAVGSIVRSVVATPWPAVTAAAAALIVIGGVLALLTAHRWPGAGRKYRQEGAESAGTGRPHDAIDSWDDLSRGEDPTR
ncbi:MULTISPECIES: Trp biosynthesis-associated membrane protein [unclassified Microbacterium]|uniref:Trp biosynthesis-associated membrane protein n=1 Tax=unclassified Microbacterium TaxID=2609290 RepID=UPI0038666CFD